MGSHIFSYGARNITAFPICNLSVVGSVTAFTSEIQGKRLLLLLTNNDKVIWNITGIQFFFQFAQNKKKNWRLVLLFVICYFPNEYTL